MQAKPIIAILMLLLAASPLPGCLSPETFEDLSQYRQDSEALAPYGADYSARIRRALVSRVRLPEDRRQDVARGTAATVGFAGLDQGQKVAEVIIGGGFYTRVLSAVVGRDGRVTAWQPPEIIVLRPDLSGALDAVDRLRNVTGNRSSLSTPQLPSGLDVVFTNQNYHDLHLAALPPDTAATVNAAVFQALRPGGHYVIVDHHAVEGSGTSDVDRLHRIDFNAVIEEVLAAGFVLEDQSTDRYKPADNRRLSVFDPAVRGRTSQFMLKFRKPDATS